MTAAWPALPPYALLLGMTLEEAAGQPILVLPWSDDVLGRPGFLHGGAIGGLLEMAAIVGLTHAIGDAGVGLKPVNLTVDYMRGGRDRPTHAAAHVRRLGRRVANVDATAWQDDPAAPIAAARLTFLLRR